VNSDITVAVVFVHGLAADAQTYFCDGMEAVSAEGLAKSALVLSPWFGNSQATGAEWLPSSGNSTWLSAYWNTYRWVAGGNASPEPSKYTTSFDILDAIVSTLATAKSSGRFPNLSRVTLNGFSAGAQVLSRWAFFSSYANGAVDTGLTIRTIVADGSSYLYLDQKRPAEECRVETDTGTQHTCDSFAVPNVTACPTYDNFKYGLNLSNVGYNLYLDSFQADPDLIANATTAFLNSTEVRFIFGNEDVCNCNTEGYSNTQSTICYPSGTACSPNTYGSTLNGVACCDTYPDTLTDNALAVNCEDLLLGSNRLQRGINYMYYLSQQRSLQNVSATKFRAVRDETYGFFQGGHNNSAFYASTLFKKWAYSSD